VHKIEYNPLEANLEEFSNGYNLLQIENHHVSPSLLNTIVNACQVGLTVLKLVRAAKGVIS